MKSMESNHSSFLNKVKSRAENFGTAFFIISYWDLFKT